MIVAVDQRDLEVDHWEAGEDARSEHGLETLLDTGDVFLRYVAADNLAVEQEAGFAGRHWRGDDLDAGVLARAPGLLLVGVIDRHLPADLLAIGDLRRTDIGFHLVGALEDVDLDVEMQFAHPLEDGLAGLLVGVDAE